LKGLANLHQHYRASGLHERADAVAALASILVMARTPNRLPGGAA